MAEKIKRGELRACTRCIYDETIPAISFDEEGICNYCRMIESLTAEYQTGTREGEDRLLTIIDEIKVKAKKRKQKYDVAIGVSGGTDSSFLVYKAVTSWGLKPLAVHYDNTWNSAIATQNIRKVLGKLRVDLVTHVVDNQESDDLFLAFFRAGVPELDGPTDIAAPEVMYRTCGQHGIKYIMEGHNFLGEGVSPLGNMYIDGRYIESVHKQYGSMKKLKTFPNMSLVSFLKWTVLYGIKKIRPLWYIPYRKNEAREILSKEFGWEYYGGHHLENRLTAFHHSYYNPMKFNLDQRNNSISAAIRSGIMSRQEGIEEYCRPPFMEPELLDYFKKRLELSDEEFASIMGGPRKSYRNFATYKRYFEVMRPLFYVLAKRGYVPMSFYIKYTSRNEI